MRRKLSKLSFSLRGLVFVALILCASMLSACGPSLTGTVLASGDELKTASDNLQQSSKETAKELSENTSAVVKKLSENSPDLKGASESWEKSWSDVSDRTTKLDEDVKAVREKAEAYFKELEGVTAGIADSSLKTAEMEKNRALKERWVKEYAEAARGVTTIHKLSQDAGDFQKVLLAANLRQKLENNISEIKDIALRARTILADLEKFGAESHALVKS